MGWIISLVALFVGATKGNIDFLYVSGLFAIAGSIGGAANIIKNSLDKFSVNSKEEDSTDV